MYARLNNALENKRRVPRLKRTNHIAHIQRYKKSTTVKNAYVYVPIYIDAEINCSSN